MKIAFILDDSVNQELLQQQIAECCERKCTFYWINENYHSLFAIQPDILFLSTELIQTSFSEVIKQLKGLTFDLVIVSPNEKFAIKAFQYGALHYIVSPISMVDIERLKSKIAKFLITKS